MTSKPMHPCGYPSCPELVRTPRCPEHTITREERNPKDPAQAQFYGSVQWKTLRRIVKARDPICKICNRNPTTEADHIDDNWENNDLDTNLQGVCSTCHNTKSGRQHNRWKRKPEELDLLPFVILVGPAGVGKTTIRTHLAPMLKAVSLGPDDVGGSHATNTSPRWNDLLDVLDVSPVAVVECCVVPRALMWKARRRGAVIVEVTLGEEERRRRLTHRGHSTSEVRRLMGQSGKLGYEQEITPDLRVDAGGDPKAVAHTIADRAKARGIPCK